MTILFSNDQWMVTDQGMDFRDERHKYPIEAHRLTLGEIADGRRLYHWPLHIATKPWADLKLFNEAWSEALTFHAGNYDPPLDLAVMAASILLAAARRRQEELKPSWS